MSGALYVLYGARIPVGSGMTVVFGKITTCATEARVRIPQDCLGTQLPARIVTSRIGLIGEVPEWPNGPVSKTGRGLAPSRVRIPPSPLSSNLPFRPRYSLFAITCHNLRN